MKGVFGDRSAEKIFHTVENSGNWKTADQTDLIEEGIATSRHRPILRYYSDQTDLIEEGIATILPASVASPYKYWTRPNRPD